MINQYVLFKRGNTYYVEDRHTHKQTSLRTKCPQQARQLVQARNDSLQQPLMNLALAKTYLAAQDPKLINRTWAEVMDKFCDRGKEATRIRHRRVIQSEPMRLLRDKKIIETTADDFIEVINLGGNSTNGFLQTLHNDALGWGWLPAPILPRKMWPRVQKRRRRAITLEEHKQLVSSFEDQEWQDYLELLWLTGASQTDGANLTSANIDWPNRVISYYRAKLEGRGIPPAILSIGEKLETLLRRLPAEGPLFPRISQMDDRSRACLTWKHCKQLKIEGISLHSYRYAWAERAKIAGIPQRWAQAALGHNSKAVHDAYARSALVVCPALES